MKTNSSQANKNGSQKGSFLGGGSPKLTKKEAEIVSLILEDDLTPKQLSLRRQFSYSYSCRIFRKLQKKGVLQKVHKKVHTKGLGGEPSGVRLHGERWKIRIIYKDDRYTKILKGTNTITIDKNTVKLYEDTIIIYSNHSFYAVDAEGATIKSLNYWNRFFVRLENDLKVILVKERSQNIKRYRQEYALVNNGIAKKCNEEGQKICIRSREDGRIWFEIDNSLNVHEAETKHPKTAEPDMKDVIEPMLNNFKEYHYKVGEPFNPLQMGQLLGGVIKSQENLTDNFNNYAENIKSHVAAINKMAALLEKIESRL